LILREKKKKVPDIEEQPENTELLREILKWQRFENFPKLRKALLDTLKTDREKLVYENTDGDKSRNDISRDTGVPESTIKDWWDKWYDQGILQPSGKRKGRPQKIMPLEDMGIDIPKSAVAKSIAVGQEKPAGLQKDSA
jgi:transposase-like protein